MLKKSKMLVNRYLGSHLKESIQNSELKVAKVSDFNDPFEFRYRYIGEYRHSYAEREIRERLKSKSFLEKLRATPRFKGLSRKKIEKIFQDDKERVLYEVVSNTPKANQELIDSIPSRADETTRILCFTTPSKNPHEEMLLWGHYTNCHRGARIWIDLSTQRYPLSVSYPVQYKDALVSIDYDRSTDNSYIESKIRESMITKSKCWSYEGEVRSFIPKPYFHTKRQNGQDLDFIAINLEGIERIDFGIDFPQPEIKEIMAFLRDTSSRTVQFYQASCSYLEYEIKYNEIKAEQAARGNAS